MVNIHQLYNAYAIPPFGLGKGDAEVLVGLLENLPENPMILEVGSWRGHSTSFLAHMAKEKKGRVYCVDHWEGSIGTGQPDEVKKQNVFFQFKDNLETFNLWDVVNPLYMSSFNASLIVADNTFDLIFIDGDHLYHATTNDINWWWPKVVKGGILCGHDCEQKFSNMNTEGQSFIQKSLDRECVSSHHPGVIFALYNIFQDDYERSATIWWKRK